ncbi:MAG: beta-galactosidase [Phycisphaerales bacterium]|jgi:hypothetical protein
MPSVTNDGRSFLVDGRRVWLVSGRLPYARLPRETWAERIHQAKLAGLNTIETPIFWSRHEPRPGRFDFTGENDLRHFVDLVGKAGLYCILGLGPYVGAGYDMGGLPPWLSGQTLRTGNGPFLEASSRFFNAVSDQIKGWQMTAPGTGGPIILVQCESHWTCGHDTLAASYLGELTRYIREAGISVPVVNANNLWQSIEGQIDGWSGDGPMLGTMRQLATINQGQPRLVIDLSLAPRDAWGRDPATPPDAGHVLRRLCEITAGGGQFNLTSFCNGTNFGFSGGKLGTGVDDFAATTVSGGSIIDEAGHATPALLAVRRIATAASRFARVFANLDPTYQPIVADPAARSGVCSVVHAAGAQGAVAFLFGDEPGATKPVLRTVTLLLNDGSALPAPVKSTGVSWCLFDVNVSGRSRLDYANISALGHAGRSLVLFGPAGAKAIVSVNGSPLETDVPDGEAPVVLDHEGLTLVILDEDQADTTFITDDAVFVGVAGVTPEGQAIPLAGHKSYLKVSADGTHKTINHDTHAPKHKADKVTMSAWQSADCEDYVDGTSARYAVVSGPSDLGALGCPFGYGWYRLSLGGVSTRKAHVAFPASGDRLHFFAGAKPVGLVGVGPGAKPDASLSLKKNASFVVLADNLGRACEGISLGERKGLTGGGFEVRPISGIKPKITEGQPIDMLTTRSPLWEVSQGDTTSAERIAWTLPHRKKGDVILTFDEPPSHAFLLVNDAPIAYIDRIGPRQVVISNEQLGKGNAVIQLAIPASDDASEVMAAVAKTTHFHEVVSSVLDGAEISFAKWEMPGATFFGPAPTKKTPAGLPLWHRCTLSIEHAAPPLFLELTGLTKGQVYLNGRHVCRYFVATPDGKRLPSQQRVFLPGAWLKPREANELTIFDEHGGSPSKVHVVR